MRLIVAVIVALILAGLTGFFLIHRGMADHPAPVEAAKAPLDFKLLPTQPYKAAAPAAAPADSLAQAAPSLDFSSHSAPIEDTTRAALKDASVLIQQGKLDDAMTLLNTSLQTSPNDPAIYNARAFIDVQQHHLDLAKQDLAKCLELGDQTSLTKFDLAEIDFLQKNYDAARSGFVALEADPIRGDLSTFKVFLCDLLGGHNDQASQELGLFNANGIHASYYFANIAWETYHQRPDQARTWLESANRIYSPQKLNLYSSSLESLGYLPLPPPSTDPK